MLLLPTGPLRWPSSYNAAHWCLIAAATRFYQATRNSPNHCVQLASARSRGFTLPFFCYLYPSLMFYSHTVTDTKQPSAHVLLLMLFKTRFFVKTTALLGVCWQKLDVGLDSPQKTRELQSLLAAVERPKQRLATREPTARLLDWGNGTQHRYSPIGNGVIPLL